MNLAHLALFYLFSKAAKGGAEPSWPTRKSPPPRRAHTKKAAAHRPAHPAAHKPTSSRRPSHKPAAHAAPTGPSHSQHHVPVHHAEPAHEGGTPYKNLDFSQAHPAAAEHPAGTPYRNLDFSQVPTQREEAEQQSLQEMHEAPPEPAPAATDPSVVSVRDVQRILVGLGWTGPNTMQGPVQKSLTDGLWGPVTQNDWIRSANKRGLSPDIARLGPTTAHVDPDTFAALRSVAKDRGAVVGAPDGRMLRIP